MLAGNTIPAREKSDCGTAGHVLVVLAFLITYTVGIATLVASGAWLQGLPRIVSFYCGRLGVVIGPGLAAIIVTLVVSGRSGVRRLLRTVRIGPRETALAMAFAIVTMAVSVAAYVSNGTPLATIGTTGTRNWTLLLAHLVLQWLVVGVGEELGWRGWLLPALLERYSRLKATLFVAMIWCVWHFPLLLGGGKIAGSMILATFAFSILFTVLWHSTAGSVGTVAAAHGAANLPAMFMATFVDLDRAASAWLAECATWVLIALAVMVVEWKWWRGSTGQLIVGAEAAAG